MPEEDFHLPDHVRFQAHEGHASAWPFPRMDGRDRARPSNDAPGTDAVPARRDKFHASLQGVAARRQTA